MRVMDVERMEGVCSFGNREANFKGRGRLRHGKDGYQLLRFPTDPIDVLFRLSNDKSKKKNNKTLNYLGYIRFTWNKHTCANHISDGESKQTHSACYV